MSHSQDNLDPMAMRGMDLDVSGPSDTERGTDIEPSTPTREDSPDLPFDIPDVIPTNEQDLAIEYPPEQRALYEPFVIKILNLNASTKSSARLQAENIVRKLEPMTLPAHPHRQDSVATPIPIHRLSVWSGDHNRNQSSAAVGFPVHAYLDGSVDDRSLSYVLRQIRRRGHTCEIASAPGNDRSTILNFVLAPDRDATRRTSNQIPINLNKMSRDTVTTLLSSAMHDLGCSISNTWGIRTDQTTSGTIIRGSCSDPDPKRCKAIIDQSIFKFDESALKITFSSPRFIQPSYFTTMALYIGSILGTDELNWYRAKIETLVARYNNAGPTTKAWVFDFRFVMEGRFVAFNPSDPLLLNYLADQQICNFFPRPVWDLNKEPSNFVDKELLAWRDHRALQLGLLTTGKKRSAREISPEANPAVPNFGFGSIHPFSFVPQTQPQHGQAPPVSIATEQIPIPSLNYAGTPTGATRIESLSMSSNTSSTPTSANTPSSTGSDTNGLSNTNKRPRTTRTTTRTTPVSLSPEPLPRSDQYVAPAVIKFRNPASRTLPSAIAMGIGLFFVLTLATAQVAAAVDSSLTMLTLNVDKLKDAGSLKAQAVIDTIIALAPYIFVLTETPILDGPHRDVYDRLKATYSLYTTPQMVTRPAVGGITIGVHTTIASQSAISLTPDLPQNSLHIQITVQDIATTGTTNISIIGVYGPQIFGDSYKPFWQTLRGKVDTLQKWVILGDFNAVLHPREANTDHHLVRLVNNEYRSFISRTGGVDLWSLQEEIVLKDDYTCRTPTNTGKVAHSIIDRVCISHSLPGGDIRTIQNPIPRTSHRPVWSRLAVQVAGQKWSTPPNRPRLQRPSFDDPAFAKLEQLLTEEAHTHDLTRDIRDAEDFDARYDTVANIFRDVCEQTFSRGKPTGPPKIHEPTKAERHARHAVAVLTAAENAIKNGYWKTFLLTRNHIDRQILQCHARTKPHTALSKVEVAKSEALKLAASVQSKLAHDRFTSSFQRRITRTLATGAIKHLSPAQAVRVPPLITDPDTRDVVTMDDTTGYMGVWQRHFEHVLIRTPPVRQPKPWLQTPHAEAFRAASTQRPFPWPCRMTVADLRQVLAKGKAAPSPGPDDWEKWALRRSGDHWLEVIANLANYVIMTNHFPPVLKQNYIVPLYKKGDATNPTNYRGIALANTLQILIASWFTTQLSQYVWRMGFIPPTQIAAQQGARVGDMTHLLSAMDGFAKFRESTCYALKRDQKKGFDYIHDSAYRDAAAFFGLHSSVDFEAARTTTVELRVRCRRLVSNPLYTTGQTKQGDPFSPLKYVLTTAMAFWWISDRYPLIGFTFRTCRNLKSGTTSETAPPHHQGDVDALRITAVAAMDDTILFASNRNDLQSLTYDMETFQLSYNMETDWDTPEKTTVFLIGAQRRAELSEPVTFALPGGRTVTVPLSRDRTFLRTPINNPKAQFDELLAIVKSFTFPRPGKPLPMTVLRKVADTSLGARISARLQLHPLTNAHAAELSRMLNSVVKRYFNDLRPGSTKALVAPIRQGGLQFPDFQNLNAVASVTALHRALNSNNPTIRKAYTIMHGELQCCDRRSHHACRPPLSPDNGNRESPTKKSPFLTWELTRDVLTKLRCRILPPAPSLPLPPLHHLEQDQTARPLADDFSQAADVGLQLRSAAATAQHDHTVQTLRWATDGSITDSTTTTPAIATLAIVGPVTLSGRLKEKSPTILDAETLAIATAINLDNTYRRLHGVDPAVSSIVYTDQLSTVRRFMVPHIPMTVRPQEPARQYLRYVARMLKGRNNLTLVHQKGHTKDVSAQALLHTRAHDEARKARTQPASVGAPTAYADQFPLVDDDTGTIHGNLPKFVQVRWAEVTAVNPSDSDNVRRYANPHLFLYAHTAFSARVQHLTRADALPTPAWLTRYGFQAVGHCALCTQPAIDTDARHVFIHCPGLTSIRMDLHAEAKRRIATAITDGITRNKHMQLVESLMRDGPLWSGGLSLYYKGELPKFFPYDARLNGLYDAIAGLIVTITARIWSSHTQQHLRTRAIPQDGHLETNVLPIPDIRPETDDILSIHGFGNPELVQVVQDLPVDAGDDPQQQVDPYASDSEEYTDGSDRSEYYESDH